MTFDLEILIAVLGCIVMALVVLGVINAIWMAPIMDLTFEVIRVALIPFKLLLPT